MTYAIHNLELKLIMEMDDLYKPLAEIKDSLEKTQQLNQLK